MPRLNCDDAIVADPWGGGSNPDPVLNQPLRLELFVTAHVGGGWQLLIET